MSLFGVRMVTGLQRRSAYGKTYRWQAVYTAIERESLTLRNRLKRLNRKTLGHPKCTTGSSALSLNASITLDAVSTH